MASNAAQSGGLFETIVELVNIGFAGVGVVVLLLVFIILMRDKPADAPTQKLRNRFLTWGMSFAMFCGLLAIVGPWLAPPVPTPDYPTMRLEFSPRFETQNLPMPLITLPDGKKIQPSSPFPAAHGLILVSVDDAFKSFASLKQAAAQLADTATSAQEQADLAVEALAKAESGRVTTPVADVRNAEQASDKSQAATKDVAEAIKAGQYSVLHAKSQNLNRAAIDSAMARSKILGTIGR